MIGSGLKKFALENGMRVDAGLGYGNLRGFQTTVSEGSGFKQFIINTKFPDVEKLNTLQAQLNAVNLQKEFRVSRLSFAPDGIVIVFTDTVGTMKKIEEFTDWFFPLLADADAFGADICPACGLPMNGAGVWKNTSGIARCYHNGCAESLAREISAENEESRLNDTGSYVSGIVGALLGALAGGIVWGLVLYSGWVASIVGLLIAFLAEKGYNLLRGKQDKVKIVVLVLSVLLGVTFGTVFAVVLEVIQELNKSLPGWQLKELISVTQYVLEDKEALAAVSSNFFSGLFFAALGVVAFVVRAAKEVKKPKMTDLK